MRVWNSRHGRAPQKSAEQLQAQLDALLAEAQQNQYKLRRFQALELKLIGKHSLSALLQALLNPDRAQFDWDIVTLMLVDPDHELRQILERTGELPSRPQLSFVDEPAVIQQFFPQALAAPIVGRFKPAQHGALFPAGVAQPASVVLLPLVRQGAFIGSLNIGSSDAERFARSNHTDFMRHLAAVVSMCLENATNHERIKLLGLTDPLTGVNNRRYFDQRLEEESALSRRYRRPLSCLMLDIDYFKRLNDSHGHQSGDLALKQVARLTRNELRGSDVLARYGGEEFVALLVQTDHATALEVAERVRRSIERERFSDGNGQLFGLTISIGVVSSDQFVGAVVMGEELLGRADKALYRAKQQGRNKVVSWGF